jgi:hypothetical protein
VALPAIAGLICLFLPFTAKECFAEIEPYEI